MNDLNAGTVTFLLVVGIFVMVLGQIIGLW